MSAGTSVLLQLLLTPGVYLLRAWALVTLWGWYIVPFFRCSYLDYRVAVGIIMISAFTTHQVEPDQTSLTPSEKLARFIFFTIAIPLAFVGYGWIMLRLV